MDLNVFIDDLMLQDLHAVLSEMPELEGKPEIIFAYGLFIIGGIVGVNCEFARGIVSDFNREF